MVNVNSFFYFECNFFKRFDFVHSKINRWIVHMVRIITDILSVQHANARKASTFYCGLWYGGNDRCTDMRYEILFTLLGMQNCTTNWVCICYRRWCISGIMSTASVKTLYKSNEANYIHWWFNICHVCWNLGNSIHIRSLIRRRRSNKETMGENRSYSVDHHKKLQIAVAYDKSIRKIREYWDHEMLHIFWAQVGTSHAHIKELNK